MTRHVVVPSCVVIDRVTPMRTQSVGTHRGIGLGTPLLVTSTRRVVSGRCHLCSALPRPHHRNAVVGRNARRKGSVVVRVAAEAISTHTHDISVDFYSIFKARRVNSSEVSMTSALAVDRCPAAVIGSYLREVMRISCARFPTLVIPKTR